MVTLPTDKVTFSTSTPFHLKLLNINKFKISWWIGKFLAGESCSHTINNLVLIF